MKSRVIALTCCMAMAALLSYAQSANYTMAKVVSFEKLPASAQHAENGDRYKAALQLGDTLYLCQGTGPAADFLDWAPGKEFPAKIRDKVMMVKTTRDQVVELKITGKKSAK